MTSVWQQCSYYDPRRPGKIPFVNYFLHFPKYSKYRKVSYSGYLCTSLIFGTVDCCRNRVRICGCTVNCNWAAESRLFHTWPCLCCSFSVSEFLWSTIFFVLLHVRWTSSGRCMQWKILLHIGALAMLSMQVTESLKFVLFEFMYSVKCHRWLFRSPVLFSSCYGGLTDVCARGTLNGVLCTRQSTFMPVSICLLRHLIMTPGSANPLWY